jgi:5-methyltetrahydrofolate--homocysteine methyltransferase
MSQRFLEALGAGILLCDGAMGTMLYKAGLKPGDCPELLNKTAPEIVMRVHQEYVAAGARLVETNTFGANLIRLQRYGLAEQADELNRLGVEIARQAVGEKALVLASIGPLGELVEPFGEISQTDAQRAFNLQAKAFAAAGADACIVETMSDLTETVIAVQAAVAVGLPTIAHMSYEASGRTFMGVSPEQAATTLAEAGATVIGANCSVGPAEMLTVVQQLHACTALPISSMPNAGLPETIDGVDAWPLDPVEFAQWGTRLVSAGVRLIGGCCGTTPAHIAALAQILQNQLVQKV